MSERVEGEALGRAFAINQVARLSSSAGAIALSGYLFDVSEIAVPFWAYGALMAASTCLYFRLFRPYEEGAGAKVGGAPSAADRTEV